MMLVVEGVGESMWNTPPPLQKRLESLKKKARPSPHFLLK
jgi:hypothetical protein